MTRSNLSSLSMVILLQILVSGCRVDSTSPFKVDPEAGTYTFHGNLKELGPANMIINKTNPLKGSYLFQEKESLMCINSLDKLDILARFAWNPSGGSLQIELINAGKDNLKIFRIDPLVLTVQKHDHVTVISEHVVELIGPPGDTIRFILSTQEDPSWELRFFKTGETLILSLQLNGSPIVLLPEEKFKLPAFNITGGLVEQTQ